ncbi:MAG: ATP-dependent metallopeptidase FtsH/Yme1/Tma family protein, partial [Candidatus Nanopelagicales bacterium]
MDLKRIARGPIFWIVLAVLLVLLGSSLISGLGAPAQVDTGAAVSDIKAGNVDTAVITDRDQVLD